MTADASEDQFAFHADHTVTTALADMRRAFQRSGIDTPDLDARLLLCATLGLDAAALIREHTRPLGPHAPALTAAATRRLAREPVSRIIGRRGFYGRDFVLSPATLDPRPDSETVVDVALAFARRRGSKAAPLRIIDIGTGTGCLLVTLLAELPDATGLGTDVSQAALDIAARNAERHGVADRARWQKADGLVDVQPAFDLLVTNPPYIRSDLIPQLAPDVRDFDPAVALDGGTDGLAVYRRIVSELSRVLPTGCAVFEIGNDQAVAVTELLVATGTPKQWPPPLLSLDLAGHPRCVAQITLVSA